MKIKKGDQVKIVSGKDKGKSGKVTKVFPEDNKVLVEGLNLFKKHAKSRQQDKKGEIILIPKPIAVAKIMIVCPSCNKPTRIGYSVTAGDKTRICKKCKQTL
ncbi:MAG: 50S ribosomal protein L24 [bacterium]|nr:50S ribosomal protein L24 [bacterium]